MFSGVLTTSLRLIITFGRVSDKFFLKTVQIKKFGKMQKEAWHVFSLEKSIEVFQYFNRSKVFVLYETNDVRRKSR